MTSSPRIVSPSTDTERRANRWFIQTGPARLVEPATRDDIERALLVMRREQHVNRDIVAALLTDLDSNPYPITRIELMYLQSTRLGEKLEGFAREHGVLRTYSYLRDEAQKLSPAMAGGAE